MKKKKELFEFIEKNTDWNISTKRLNIKIPLYIKSGYEIWNTEIAGFGVLFLRVKDNSIDMRIHQNAKKKLEEIIPCHSVLVFEKLDSKNANSLIQKRIPFIIENKQIFLPFALMQMQTNNGNSTKLNKQQDLSTDAHTILIGYLDNVIQNGMIIKEIAQLINRETRATSKALENLENLKYLTKEKIGRYKLIYFFDKDDVFRQLKNETVTPILYTFYTNKQLINTITYSGYSALSKYSSIIDDKIKTIAVHSKLIKDIDEVKCEKDDANYKVEVWDREPSVFSKNNAVNKLYLLRTMKNIDDERTEYALEEIEENIQKELKD